MSEKEGHIILTDRKLYTVPEIYEPFDRVLSDVKDLMRTVGFYNVSGNRTLCISNYGTGLIFKPLFHEFGHAIDHYGAQISHLDEEELSENSKFILIFEKEGKNLTKYGSKDPKNFLPKRFG